MSQSQPQDSDTCNSSDSSHGRRRREPTMTTATKEQPQQQQQQQQPPPEVAVCCGCRPQRQTSRRKQKKASRLDAFRTDHVQRAMVAPAPVPTTKDEVADNDDAASVASSLFYFDAVEEPLGEEEYPPIFTTAIVHPKPQVTLDDPKTLLRKPSIIKPTTTSTQENQEPNKSGRSVRFVTIAERPASEHAELLKSPRVPQAEKGFPGGLTVVELEECVSFVVVVVVGGVLHSTKGIYHWTKWGFPSVLSLFFFFLACCCCCGCCCTFVVVVVNLFR
mmetsp:Transcript_20969/g.48695  ORF Transcript_20969/g.48695 Transcript_20969/m.48695 type:complete len:276 (+) Transcript_20969:102-929(+)